MNSKYLFGVLLLCLLSLAACRPSSDAALSSLSEARRGFDTPQDGARTKVWWFHGETETTREGITADLEAYKRAGVGGVVYYDQVHLKQTPRALPAFSTRWWEMLRFAASEAQRLGLTFEAHVGNGFVAGGPWITEELGMQMLAAADTLLQGGRRFCGKLPLPANRYTFHKEVAVLAFPVDKAHWLESTDCTPRITSNLKDFPADSLFLENAPMFWIPDQPKNRSVYINLDFGTSFTARSIIYNVRARGKATTSATNVPAPPGDTFVGTGYRLLPDLGTLEASDDGIHYHTVCALKPIYRAHSSWKQKSIAFPAVNARYYRLNLHDWYLPDDTRKAMQLGNIVLSPRARADQWEEKAGLYSEYIEPDRTPVYSSQEVIDADRLLDLTPLLAADGTLSWDVPEGDWVVMRFVHQPTGGRTKHGRPNLMGLECDKLSARATTVQWDNYFKQILDTLRRYDLPLHGMAMDSHEAASQNWTPGFDREFRRLRGYDLLRSLPVMAGYVVGSAARTDTLLHDVRRTIADLIADRYYGTLDSLCRSEGVHFTAQATGNALCIVADPIQAKGRVEIPQGEFWAIHPDGNYDIKESSSAAHLYGKPIASAEAFTDAQFRHSPAFIKSLADYAYCYGINEFVVCASAYQPWLDKLPGSTGGGRHYCLNRGNTYWDYLRPFWDYQARCAHVLRQGRAVADLCIYLGENAPVKILTHRLPDLPGGYDFDAFTTDALLSRMSARQGRVVLPDGTSYGLMLLPRSGELSPRARKKIEELAAQGVPVLTDPRRSLQPLLDSLGLRPDVRRLQGDLKQDKIWFAHRRLSDADVYFLHNHADTAVADTFVFRTSARQAAWWDPVDGRRYALPLTHTAQGDAALPLSLAPWQGGFVVLSDAASEALPPLPRVQRTLPLVVASSWNVFFDPKLGGPGSVTFDSLTDWRTHPDARIRHYSGTALYRNSVEMPTFAEGERLCLQFPALGDVARVTVNGREAGIVWCSPWQLDITDYVRPGANTLEIAVANSLMNRMIADASLPEEERITYAYPLIAKPTDEAVASGIIGEPVWVVK